MSIGKLSYNMHCSGLLFSEVASILELDEGHVSSKAGEYKRELLSEGICPSDHYFIMDELEVECNKALQAAPTASGYNDMAVSAIYFVTDRDGNGWYDVHIEEADPQDNEVDEYICNHLLNTPFSSVSMHVTTEW